MIAPTSRVQQWRDSGIFSFWASQAVTLGDVEAERTRGKKVRLERSGAPIFTTLIEIVDRNM